MSALIFLARVSLTVAILYQTNPGNKSRAIVCASTILLTLLGFLEGVYTCGGVL